MDFTIFYGLIYFIVQKQNKTVMGCESSTSNISEENMEVGRKRNMMSGLQEEVRKKLLEAIQWNDASDFAVSSDEHDVPFNAQLSEKALYWMASHYCCRWNSYKVLDYVLKAAYLQDPKNYARYINQQTVQGYTALHLCVIYNSTQCLNLLLKYGGVNINSKDNMQLTPYMETINYKRGQMKSILKRYEDLGIMFLNVENEKLSSGDLLTCETPEAGSYFEGQEDRMEQGLQQNMAQKQKKQANLFVQTQRQKQLEIQRMKIQLEKENLRQLLRKIEQEQARNQRERKLNQEEQSRRKLQRPIKQNEKSLIQQIQIKQKELSKLKADLNKIIEEKQQTILKEEIKKSQEFLMKNYAQLQEKIQLKKTIIDQQRQTVLKNREERLRGQSTRVAISSFIGGQLPEELRPAYQAAKRVGVYVDPQFPQDETSIGNNPKAKKFITDLVWLRPNQIFNGDYQLFDGIDPNDIKQGSLGVCYMLATLSTLAQSPQRIRDIFVFHDKALGFYVLKILIHGEIKYITLDDSIPCSKSTKSPLFAKPNGNQLWVCLVEKAWAKCIGNYMKTESMTPNFLMEDLTMCPSFGVWFKDKTQKTRDIDTHTKIGNIVVLISASDRKIQGIVNNHAYSLLNVYEHQGRNIYKLRNPWGKFEWKGQYEDKSPLWTSQLRQKVNLIDEDDGIFFLSESQLLQAFVYYSISITRINNKYSYIPVRTPKDQSRYFMFELKSDQEVNLRFVQKFNRMVDDAEYKYSPVVFEVGKVEDNGEVTFLTEGDNSCFWGAKSVHADPQMVKMYKKGKYFVRLSIQWVNETKYNTGVFAVFANQPVKITQLPHEQGIKYWIKLLKSFALKKSAPIIKQGMDYIMVWMRAQLVCYSYVREGEMSDQMEAKWSFNPGKFNNCEFGLNHIEGTNDLKYTIGKGTKNGNVGTLRRLIINQTCTSGQLYISATPIANP